MTEGFNLDMPGQPFRVTNVVFYVGNFGPFTRQYKAGEYTAARVKADTQCEADKLRELGAI